MLLDLLLPRGCAACGMPSRWPLCSSCSSEAEGLVLDRGGLVRLDPAVVAAGVFAYEGVVRDAVRGLKLGGRHGWGVQLGALLRARLPLPPGVPVTWVPATPARRRARGFDLPELLACGAAGTTRPKPLLRRVAERPDQTGLDHRARRLSPSGSFAARGRVPESVVLVDDVRTTGATARAAATALRTGGARRVLVATLAVASGPCTPLTESGRERSW